MGSAAARQEPRLSHGGDPGPGGGAAVGAEGARPRPTAATGSGHLRGIVPARGMIVMTDASCVVDGVAHPLIPTLVWEDGIDGLPSDYLRGRVVDRAVEAATAEAEAKVLRIFGRLLRSEGRRWDQVGDDLLVRWRGAMEAGGVGGPRQGFCLGVVYAFYVWAEETGAVRDLVGFRGGRGETRSASTGRPLTVKWTRRGWVGSVRARRGPGGPRRHTPSGDEIARAHGTLAGRSTIERDGLLMAVPQDTGARVSEMLRIRVADLPTGDRLAPFLDEDRPLQVPVKRKNSRRHAGAADFLVLPPDLVLTAIDYVEGERRSVVEAAGRRDPTYVEPPELFLSSTTGGALRPDTVTHLVGAIFKEAGIPNACVHRLRATYLVAVVEALIASLEDAESLAGPVTNLRETILVKAAAMAGNATTKSLEPYLNYCLNRRDADREGRVSRAVLEWRRSERRRAVLATRLGADARVASIQAAMRDGDPARAAADLRAIADELSREAASGG